MISIILKILCDLLSNLLFQALQYSNDPLQYIEEFYITLVCFQTLASHAHGHVSIVVGLSNRTSFSTTVVIDAYPNTAAVQQGDAVVLVCRVVGVPSTTVLSYQWTCPGGYCDAGGVDPEWAARIQQGNILVVNVRRQVNDNGVYTCTVQDNTQQVGTAMYTLTVASELCIRTGYIIYSCGSFISVMWHTMVHFIFHK